MLFQSESIGSDDSAGPVSKSMTNFLVKTLLRMLAVNLNLRPSLNSYLKSDQGWVNFSVGIRTESRSVETAIRFLNGRALVSGAIPQNPDITLIFKNDQSVRRLLSATPTEQIFMIMRSELRTEGNGSYMGLFFFLLSLLLGKKQIKLMEKERSRSKKSLSGENSGLRDEGHDAFTAPHCQPLRVERIDPGVKFLNDPYLSRYGLDDFPRLKVFLDIHFNVKAEICPERPKLLTDWFKTNGFENDSEDKPWVPERRQGLALKHLLENRKPIIRKNDLIAGTTTTKEIGVVVYPDSHGTMIWNELLTVPHRTLNPYDVSEETRRILHHEVFPFWTRRNFREWARAEYESPLCQAIDERFAVYFIWKQAALSHTIPDFPKILRLGARGVIDEIRRQQEKERHDHQGMATLDAMVHCLEGMITYSKNLSLQAVREAEAETDSVRQAELKRLAAICNRVVELPARNLDEAVNAIWITWVCLHMENTNAGLSLGRLDQWLQPYFEADLAALATAGEREAYIRHAIELIGCFFMRCTDHLPLTPDLANWYFGGSSSDQAITLGGVTPEGEDAVCDMTYVFLKVTEMLCIRDPNVNARFYPGKNSDTYLKRLCEVNLITAATPSIHNDKAVMASLAEFNYEPEDLNNWSATGCVEPTLSGKHIGHTNCMMMNMVAALEMALNNGVHPLMNWQLGPKTGNVADGDFKTFDRFFDAFSTQFGFLIDQSIEYNNMMGRAHQVIRPTPLLSSLIDGCTEAGRDVVYGGARYNSSGAACIGLADVTDSLMAIKKLVFDEKKVSFSEMKQAVDTNFENDPAIFAMATRKVPLFGSGSDEAVAMANRITRFTHDRFGAHTNYRGGAYTAGFWSMSNHVIYGTLSGALPSGKRQGKPFTPGLTPEPHASENLLDNIRDVARLEPRNMNNNIAFNVKVVPAAGEPREKIVNNMFSYARAYFDLGGMQMQMNVVTSDTLREAMAHPENYRNLLVRISGYNAYFVTLNRDMQLELIERAEFGI